MCAFYFIPLVFLAYLLLDSRKQEGKNHRRRHGFELTGMRGEALDQVEMAKNGGTVLCTLD